MMLKHKCLKCSSVLSQKAEAMECATCGCHWPIINGVPSYDSAKYFGEVTSEKMHELVASAENGNWLAAVRTLFRDSNPDMHQYIVDLNRASWIPLLPIGPDSTVLDVGSGWGTLTHALALNYKQVVSLEPIAERVAFTKIRLDQEGIKNVDLVQTTLDALPFSGEIFDLIVLNGILEWVGEWNPGRTPREAQIEVLAKLRCLLKPHGMVLIGIENRVGWGTFLGQRDHPGTRFTSLMPRWMASLYIKAMQPKFHRTVIDSTKGYRTYTYSQRGYLKLLKESGFDSVDLWWPPTGYNSPTVMCLASARGHIKSFLVHTHNYTQSLAGYALRSVLKHWMLVKTGLIYVTFPDVILMARDSEAQRGKRSLKATGSLMERLQGIVSAYFNQEVTSELNLPCAIELSSQIFGNKSIIKLATPRENYKILAIAKVANIRRPGWERLQQGFERLEQIHKVFDADERLRKTVPAPITLLREGPLIASVESVANGRALEVLSCDPNYYKDHMRVRNHLELVASWLLEASARLNALQHEIGFPSRPASSHQDPNEMEMAFSGQSGADGSWVQHGDLFIGNIFIEEQSQQVCVIDWDICGSGYPPLFDWFCVITGLHYTHKRIGRLPKGQTVDVFSFCQTYFEPSYFAEAIVDLTYRMCDQLGLDRSHLSTYFAQYLAVRAHQFSHYSESGEAERLQAQYRTSHDYFLRHSEQFIFNRYTRSQ